jgi:fibronectin type 3 domain-containing protein
MCRQKTIAVIFFAMIFFNSNGQDSFVFARNHPANSAGNLSIEVKWYQILSLFGKEFNVYRREADLAEWQRVSPNPVSKLKTLPTSLIEEDEELEFFIDALNQASPEELKDDFLKLNILIKSFESNEFARFLGIYFKDNEVLPGKSYQYKITILNGSQETVLGQSSFIEAGSYQQTGGVQDLEAYQEGRVINFNWTQNSNLYYAYNLYETDSTGSTNRLNSQPLMLSMQPDSSGELVFPKPMFKRRGSIEGASYSYYIEGIDYFGEMSQPSSLVNIRIDDVTPPPPPLNLSGRADSLRVLLKWEQGDTGDLKGYTIYRSQKSEGKFEPVTTSLLPAGNNTYNETLQVPGPYYYRVEAEDHTGNKSLSEMAFVEAQDVFPPSQPLDLTIKSDTGRFYLTWLANEEPDLKGYLLYRTVDENDPDHYVLLNAEPLDTNYYEQRLPKNVKNEFFYFLVAIDTSFNRSQPSAIATAVLPDVVAPERPVISQVGYSDEGIIVNWTRNVEEDFAGYHLYRFDSLHPEGTQVNQALIAKSSFRFIDRTADGNTEYQYRLEAIDSLGNISPLSEAAYAFRREESLLEGQLIVKLKSQKRKKINRLEWSEIDPKLIRGYVVFRGETERSIKPITGLVAATNFIDKDLKKDAYVYQVRAYSIPGKVIISRTVEWEVR